MKKLTIFPCLLATMLLILFGSKSTFAAANIKIVGALTHEKVTSAGANYDGNFLVRNAGTSSCQVRIYLVDYLFQSDGTNTYGKPGSTPYSNANWITFGANWLTIPAGETATVNYRVQVPQNSGLRGTYWSMVMVEPVEDQMMAGQGQKKALGIQAVIRYGIQLVTNIGDTGIRRIQFLDKKMIVSGGQRFLQLDIKNSGERWLSPTVSLQLYNHEGKLLGDVRTNKIRIFPSCSVRSKLALPNIPRGKYKALVIIDNGDQYVFGANYDLVIEK
jgi:hypothetical protein